MIGIISDTHDNVVEIKKAVEIFKQNKVELVIHCGDIIAPATVKYFSGLKMFFCQGNCDGDVEHLRKKIEEIDGQLFAKLGELEHKGKNIAFVHGNDITMLRELIESQKYGYVFYGHNHIAKDELNGSTRAVNPGSLYLGNEKHSIVLLDLESDEIKFVEVK